MTSNRAFWRAVYSLTHPLTIVSVILLLLNDHWLRWMHPSWLTGKLGDFTWLLFAPFIAALFFAVILPRRWKHHEQAVGLLAFVTIGLWFALAKTVPLVHGLTTEAWEALVGWQGSLRMDATDLLTLPALLIGWWIWRRAPATPLNARPLAYVVFGMAIMATLADQPPRVPEYTTKIDGIGEICWNPRRLYAFVTGTIFNTRNGKVVGSIENPPEDYNNYTHSSAPTAFVSSDGGWRWSAVPAGEYPLSGYICSDSQSYALDPSDPNIRYSWQSGVSVQRSTDGGDTWTTELDLSQSQEEIGEYYYARRFQEHPSQYPGGYAIKLLPLDGVVDPYTGNLVLAMGLDGVLIRTTRGEWHWSSVGGYYHEDIHSLDNILDVLSLQGYLAGALFFLIQHSALVYVLNVNLIRRLILTAFFWANWVFFTLTLNPASGDPRLDMGMLSLPVLMVIGLPVIGLAIWSLSVLYREIENQQIIGQVLRPSLHVALGAGLLYIFPFVLWTQGTIPRYTTAAVFAVLLVAMSVAAGFFFYRDHLPVMKKKKPKVEELDVADEG